MPNTTRGNVPYPAGNEAATRLSIVNAIIAITDTFALLTELDGHADAAVLDHPDASVTTAKIAGNAVTAAKLNADVSTLLQMLGDSDDDVNRVVAMDVPTDLRRPYYAYDAEGRVETVTWRNQGNTVTYATETYTYNADGTVNTRTLVVGALTVTWTYAYNADGTVANIAKTVA